MIYIYIYIPFVSPLSLNTANRQFTMNYEYDSAYRAEAQILDTQVHR